MTRLGLGEWRWDKIKRLIAHAHANVPYYRRLLNDAGIRPVDIRRPEDFREIPVLTRQDVLENAEDLRATSLPAGMEVVAVQTAGTTGKPLQLFRNTDCDALARAALFRSFSWTGYRLGDPMLLLTAGTPPAAARSLVQRLGRLAMNCHYMSGLELSAETLEGYVDMVRRRRIRFLRGYATLLHRFAALCEMAGIDDIHLAAVYPTAEMLTGPQRATIERVFHTQVYDHYECAEVDVIANECPEGRKLHVIDEHVYVEEISSDELGENALVVTDLDNYAQPLIRYVNGDRGRLSTERCGCKRNLGVLEEFLGRSGDAVILAGGDPYPGVFFRELFGHFDGVTQFQVVQHAPGELVIRIIRNARYTRENEGEIKRLIAEHTGIIADVDYVDEIERAPSGKITSVICNVSGI
jgi:phenylacetate-CoA ligase